MEAIFRKSTLFMYRESRKLLYTSFITYIFTSFYLYFRVSIWPAWAPSYLAHSLVCRPNFSLIFPGIYGYKEAKAPITAARNTASVLQGCIQKFPVSTCKKKFAYLGCYIPQSPSKYSPFARIQRSQRFCYAWKHPWKSLFGIVSSTRCVSSWISSMVSNLRLFIRSFSLGKRKKSQGARSGEYGGWGITDM